MVVIKDNKVILKNDYFHELLKNKGMTITGLSRIMGVNPSTIYRMMNQETEVSSNVIAKMMAAFGLKEADFGELFIFKSTLLKSNDDDKEVIK
ncbi:hypothetical protein FC84_GL001624 [Lapidilactobacillus dextrinicus DSM 20335]|uniref:HTH cro/C1-type domain-containing protein n=1 Tax=Lapidilactobacillus dextrinicus DSM 20335 TaxID=1423738 RepID=A0A0R2BKN7_9LACO|nr:helix-turn-helix transcriptional regulator [Lapidilactobacillus dextrinicus]KRM79445.1 hypothetical protein FC84_GL001624 [Lapidilactobacillus dextrinicus DSM 20335]